MIDCRSALVSIISLGSFKLHYSQPVCPISPARYAGREVIRRRATGQLVIIMAVTHAVFIKHLDGRDVVRAGSIVLINDRALFWDDADIIEILSGIFRDRDLDLLRGWIDDYFQF